MPRLSTAIETAEVGYEAARLVASVATAETVAEWIARASERTIRFLREEVEAMKEATIPAKTWRACVSGVT